MTRSQSIFLLCALFSLPAHSGFITFAQWIPWDFVSAEIKKHELNIHESRAALTFTVGELKPEVQNLTLTMNGTTSGLVSSGGVLTAESSGAMGLQLGSVRIDQIIQRNFGGNTISVRIQATCSAAKIEIPSFSLQSEFSLSASDHLPSLRDFAIRIPNGSWSVTPIHCEGLSGIGEEIEASLNSALMNPSLFTPLLRDWIAPRMNQWVREQWLSVVDGDSWNNLRISESTDEGFMIRGDIALTSSDEIDLPEKLPDSLTGDRPRFLVSRAGYEALIQDRLRVLLPAQYDLRQNESFQKLLKSRLMQFVAWPDLMRFNPSTPFVLKNDPSSLRLSLSYSQGNWKADLTEKGSLVTVVSGSPIDYLVYGMSVSVPVTMNLQGGDLYFATGKATAKIAWSFGYLYQLLYKPQNKIPVNVITAALADLASGRIQKVALPRFQIGDRELIFTNLTVQENFITMEWP